MRGLLSRLSVPLCIGVAYAGAAPGHAQDMTRLVAGDSRTQTLSPGETQSFSAALSPGFYEIQAVEFGIDVELVVELPDTTLATDSPTARFAHETLWLKIPEPVAATIHVRAFAERHEPSGQYTLAIRGPSVSNRQQADAEVLTEEAVNSFNRSYAANLSATQRIRLRQRAAEQYRDAAEQWRSLKRLDLAGYSAHAAGFINGVLLNREDLAQRDLVAAREWYRLANLSGHAAASAKDIGQSFRRERRYDAAIEQLQLIADSENTESPVANFLTAVARNDLCLVYQNLGRFAAARDQCFAAARDFEHVGDVLELNNTSHNMARIELLAGNHRRGVALARNALERHRAAGSHVQQAMTLSLLISALRDLGDLDAAIAAYQEANAIFEREGMLKWQVDSLTHQAQMERELGRFERAGEHLTRAAELAAIANARDQQLSIAMMLARNELARSQPAKAIQALRYALSAGQIDARDIRALRAQLLLADAYRQAREAETAFAILAGPALQSLAPHLMAEAKLIEARLLVDTEQWPSAFEALAEAKQKAEMSGDQLKLLEVIEIEASTLSSRGRWDDAERSLSTHFDAMLDVAGNLALPELRSRYLSQQLSYFETMLEAISNGSRPESEKTLRLLNTIEAVRAAASRAHAAALGSGGLSAIPQASRLEYFERLSKVRRALDASKTDGENDNSATIAALAMLESAQTELWQEGALASMLERPVPLSANSLTGLPGTGTGILYLYAGHSTQFGVYIDQNGMRRFAIATGAVLEHKVQEALAALSSPNSADGIHSPALQWLSKQLLSPIVESLDNIDSLIIVPSANLDHFPFAALPHPISGEPLVRSHTLQQGTSLAALKLRPKHTFANAAVIAVGDPVTSRIDNRLPQTSTDVDGPVRLFQSGRELAAIETLFGGTTRILTGFEANRSAILDLAGQPMDILHFAAHAVANSNSSVDSGLFLSRFNPDGEAIEHQFGLADLFGTHLNVRLAVLSGCETSIGRSDWTEGSVGLGRAFRYSGADAVISTLWRVDDQTSAEIMSLFYAALAKGDTPAAALRQAQNQIAQQTRFRHPYFWAGYQLLDDQLFDESLALNVSQNID